MKRENFSLMLAVCCVISVVSRSISADSASRLWRAERTAGPARAEAAKARMAKMAAFILLVCALLCCFLVGEGKRSQEARVLENRRKEDSCCLLLLSAAVCCWRKERKRREGLGGLKATYLCSSSLPLCHCVSTDMGRWSYFPLPSPSSKLSSIVNKCRSSRRVSCIVNHGSLDFQTVPRPVSRGRQSTERTP